MKKIFFPLIVLMLFPASAFASFQDVGTSYSYYNAVNYVQTEQIVQGYADGTFKPATLINRAEFTKIIINSLYSAEKIAACTPAKSLSDIASSDWFYPYVCVAVNEGVINGYPDGTFKPSNSINFAEACKILISAYDISNTATDGAWYQQYIDAFKSKGTKPASITSPNQQISRGETAEMIYQLKESVPAWAKGATTTSTTTTSTTSATEEVKVLFATISKLSKLEDYYPYLSKANLNEIKNLVSMISVEENDPFAKETLDFGKSTIKSTNLPGNLTTIPIISVNDNGSHRKVLLSGTVGGYTLTACMGLLKEDGSWKIDEYLLGPMETMTDKCKDAKTYVELLNSADLVAARLTYSSEYDFKVYLNGYYLVGVGLGGGVKDIKLPLLKGTNKLQIVMGESLKQYIKADDPMAALAKTIIGSKVKIEAGGKTLVDFTQNEGNMVKTVDFTY
ncbi:S-layer homology domain-containing protein [Candidatus Gracilibacteria bacterium]|nr:S-layer homology domain-containing protein [Candidatus Gracilibacteria bacterium]